MYQLLSSFLSITPDTHPDMKEGRVTLAAISSLLTEANSLEKRACNERELKSLYNSIRGCPVLVEMGRRLEGVWTADLMVSTQQSAEKKLESIDSLKLYLFSDALLLSRVKLSHPGFSPEVKEEEEFLDSIGLSRVTVYEVTSGEGPDFGCEIKGVKKVWKVSFLCEEDRTCFLECFSSLTC